MYLQVASPGCTYSSYSHSISVRYRYLLMLFSFNILVSTFHCAWPAWIPANKLDIKWIWCKFWPYTSCYRWLQTHQPTLHCATDPYTCATLCYKQGQLPQVYHCYSGYIALLIWPLFSRCGLHNLSLGHNNWCWSDRIARRTGAHKYCGFFSRWLPNHFCNWQECASLVCDYRYLSSVAMFLSQFLYRGK